MRMLQEKYSFNYLYYGLVFLVLAWVQGYHIYLVVENDFMTKMVFIAYSVIQIGVESVLLGIVSSWILSLHWKKIHVLYLTLVGTLCFFHLCDFFFKRLMDMSVWKGIDIILIKQSFSNFIELLYSCNVELVNWLIVFLIIFSVIISSVLLFFYLQKFCEKHPFVMKKRSFFWSMFLLSVATLSMEIQMNPELKETLTWNWFFSKNKNLFFVKQGFLPPFKQVPEVVCMESEKPDLFLIVSESLRKDFLETETVPHLAKFRQEYAQFESAYSSANATQSSWYALFYSINPLYFGTYADPQGAHCLSYFKKLGYQIHIYASSRLNFYGMNRMLFGQDDCIADTVSEFRTEDTLCAYETDQMAVDGMIQEAIKGKGGRVFVVFLDATHLGYSFPSDQKTVFAPYASMIDYIQMACSRQGMDLVKNRYRNALVYTDGLFQKFRSALEENNLWDDSLVVFTSDHGEEFGEAGNVFHASKLSFEQINIPLYMKLGKKTDLLDQTALTTQIDIFPTIFDYLTDGRMQKEMFHGTSLLAKQRSPYVMGVRFNAALPPVEFYVQTKSCRLIAKIENSNTIELKQLFEGHNSVPIDIQKIRTEFGDFFNEWFHEK